MSTFTVRAELGGCKAPPFAQLPHDIAADPRLTPVDVRVIAALLFWARDKASAWPSDASIGKRVGRAVATVQRSLRRLQALGLLQREKVEPTDNNRTGRVIRLVWRVDHPCDTPRSPVSKTPCSSVIDEGRIEREKERPIEGPGQDGPPPSAEELELWASWAEGSNATLARIGRAALATAGVVQEAGDVRGADSRSSPDAPTTPLPSPSGGVGIAVAGPDDAMVRDLPVEDAGDVLADRPVAAVGLDQDPLEQVVREVDRPSLDPLRRTGVGGPGRLPRRAPLAPGGRDFGLGELVALGDVLPFRVGGGAWLRRRRPLQHPRE